MRTLTSAERTLLGSRRFWIFAAVDLRNASGAWVDLTNLLGKNWFKSAEWSTTLDDTVARATITLIRESMIANTFTSLNPIVASSGVNAGGPLIDYAREIRVRTAVVDAGTARPAAGDAAWRHVFYGKITAIEAGGTTNAIVLSALDIGSRLADAQVREETVYSDDAGTLDEVVMERIRLDWAPYTPSIVTPVSPGWMVKTFKQERASVLSALRDKLARDQIGWDFRYRWIDATTFVPVFQDPDRNTSTPMATFAGSEYLAIPSAGGNDDDLRNVVDVDYLDATTGKRATAHAENAASIARFGGPGVGERYMRISFGDDKKNINGQALADAAVSDLAFPDIGFSIETLYWWPAEIGDYYQFGPNRDQFTTAQNLAVVGITHRLTDGSGRTTFQLRGQPAAARQGWYLAGGGAGQPELPDPDDATLTNLSYEDTPTTRRISWTRGKSVEFIWVQDRVLPMPVSTDPWPNETDAPDVILRDEDTYLAQKPLPGEERFVLLTPWYKRDESYRRGHVIKVIIDPDPVALAAVLKVTVRNDVADVAVTMTGGANDFPVTVDVYEESVDVPPIATLVFLAPGTKSKIDDYRLGNRALPLRALLHWQAKITNAANEVRWSAPASADRDALPSVEVSFGDFNANAEIRVDYDDDDDEVRVTCPDGKVRSWAGLVGSGIVIYTVGVTLRGDGTVEAPLGVGEVRGPYIVEAVGGGQVKPFWTGNLHGAPVLPPIVHPRGVRSADRDAEDVYGVVETYAPERVTLRVRDGDGALAPLYYLVTGPGDHTPLYVVNGTEIGPAHWFTTGPAQPIVAKLSGVPLVRDQIKKLNLQAVGEESGIEGPWASLALSLMEAPYLASVSLTWDKVAQRLRARVVGGPHIASALLEVDDDPSFGSPLTATITLVEGDEVFTPFTLAGGNLGKPWYLRVTPYNRITLGGLAGAPSIAETMVDPIVSVQVAVPTNDTIEVHVDDPGGFVDAAIRVRFYVTVGDGLRTLFVPSTVPSGGATTGYYTLTIAQDEKHTTLIEPIVYLRDGTQIKPGPQTLDADTIAQVINADTAYAGAVGTVRATVDSDAAVGANNFEVTIGGTAPFTLAVPASRAISFNVALTTGARQTVSMRAKNGLGQWGPPVVIEVNRYDTPSVGPSLNVTMTEGALVDTISYTASSTITYTIDGVVSSLPASPFAVSRNVAGGRAKSLGFSVTSGGQTVTEEITVNPVDADTATPDVQLNPNVASSAGTLAFLAIATDPRTGAFINATFTFVDCSGTVGSTAVAFGGTLTVVANNISVVANRPALGAKPGTLRMRSTISGGGAAEINRTVSEATKDFTPPVFEPTFSLGTLTGVGSWFAPASGIWIYAKTDTSGWGLQYDGIGVFNTSYSVSRNPSGGASKTMYLKAVNTVTNAETVVSFPVDAQVASGGGGGTTYGFTSYVVNPDPSTDTFIHSFAGTFPGGAIFHVWQWNSAAGGGFEDVALSGGSGIASPAGENIVSSGGVPITYKFYVTCESGAGVVATSATRSVSTQYIP